MNNTVDFVKGQQYTNRRGTYTVLDVKSTTLSVRYDDGTEETLNKVIQERIMNNMTLPPRTPEPPPRSRTGIKTAVKPAAKPAAKPPAKPRAKKAVAVSAAQD